MSTFSLILITNLIGINTITLNCPNGSNSCGECTGLSSGDSCEMICSGQDDCANTILSCTDNFPCIVKCIGYDACDTAILNGGQATSLEVVCGQSSGSGLIADCQSLTINAQSVIDVYVHCLGNGNRCPQMMLNCGIGICEIECEGNSCGGIYGSVTVDARSASSFNCTGDGCSTIGLIITSGPTTILPTTTTPTTSIPTTSMPTTSTPTASPTLNPSTNPTTIIPTTSNPSTATPTTVAPTRNTNDGGVIEDTETSQTEEDDNSQSMQSNADSTWVVVGIVVLCFVLVVIMIALALIWMQKRNKINFKQTTEEKLAVENVNTVQLGQRTTFNEPFDPPDNRDGGDIIANTLTNGNMVNGVGLKYDEFIVDGDDQDDGTKGEENEFVIHGDDDDDGTKGEENDNDNIDTTR